MEEPLPARSYLKHLIEKHILVTHNNVEQQGKPVSLSLGVERIPTVFHRPTIRGESLKLVRSGIRDFLGNSKYPVFGFMHRVKREHRETLRKIISSNFHENQR